ncbi:MAG: flagellar hook-basal body complex protein FliE [Steroidobacteraceae bacterium]|nr:flagellar hook-basal body complex protein FliE [Steroidobacteraceae bacterium]MDW8258436.1 flagellar hook-basal body complex protein FliE [Gammaproteobacteria bacterium]
MSAIEIQRVLTQIRELRAQASLAPAVPTPAPAAHRVDFATLLRRGIDAVNAQQQHAARLTQAFERGVPGVELSHVMVEAQKASIAFRATVEVRNRLVSAYQDIMNMPV